MVVRKRVANATSPKRGGRARTVGERNEPGLDSVLSLHACGPKSGLETVRRDDVQDPFLFTRRFDSRRNSNSAEQQGTVLEKP